MSPAALLEVASHLKAEAEQLRRGHLDAEALADRLDAASEKLLEEVPGFSVAAVAQLLGQSRPTVYDWIHHGYLLTQEAEGRGLRVSPESLLVLLPILLEWQKEGRQGHPSRLLREWYEGAIRRQEQRRQFAEQRRNGQTDLRPPRRPVSVAAE